MASPPYQKLFWGSYHKHTAHLSHAREHGAYLLLLGALWNNDGKLPADDKSLAGYAKLSLKEWAAVKPKLMAMFRVSRGKLTQPRVTEDLAKFNDISGKRKEAGKTGGNASAGNRKGNRTANASVLPTYSEPDYIDNPQKPPEGAFSDPMFAQAWSAYPEEGRATSDPGKSATAWAGMGEEPALVLAAVRAFAASSAVTGPRAKAPPKFEVWLRGRRWAAFLSGPAGIGTKPGAWAGPTEVREAVAASLERPEYAETYLRSCDWRDLPARTLIARNGAILDRLRRQCERALSAIGVGIVFEGEQAA